MATLEINTLFDEILDFLASTPTREQIIAFKPSDALQERLRDLLDRNQNGVLTAEERDELDEFSRMNHFMSMLKIRARKKAMSRIPQTLRQLVITRANGCCEYCLLHQDDNTFSHEVDHVIATKHRGEPTLLNLCLSCLDCNRHKGSDIASIDLDTGQVVRLFNPRQDVWSEHFSLNSAIIEPLTAQGRVTVFLLDMNSDEQVAKRTELISLNRYPCKTSL